MSRPGLYVLVILGTLASCDANDKATKILNRTEVVACVPAPTVDAK